MKLLHTAALTLVLAFPSILLLSSSAYAEGKADLVAIKKSGGGQTEVHILSGASNFQQFIGHFPTALHETGNTFDFAMTDWDSDGKSDLVAIKKSGGGTTEVHILSGASNFQQFIGHSATALHETGNTFDFVLDSRSAIAIDNRVWEPEPLPNSINQGLTSPTATFLISELGVPGALNDDCTYVVTDPKIKNQIVTEDVGPFKVTGLKPAVSAIRRVFQKVKIADRELYNQLTTEGMLCIRKVRGGNSFSNHSWGLAIDIIIKKNPDDKSTDVHGDDKTQLGLKKLYPYFHAEKFYWGASFPKEDSMHFEVSQELITQWKESGEIPR